MTARYAFATVAQFTLEASGTDPGARRTAFSSLAKVAEEMKLSEERRAAEDAVRAMNNADEAQMTFDAVIRERLGKESA